MLKWWSGPLSKPSITNEKDVTLREMIEVVEQALRRYRDAYLDRVRFGHGFAVSVEEKEFVEAVQEVSMEGDLFRTWYKKTNA